jgi:hypothetical protein
MMRVMLRARGLWTTIKEGATDEVEDQMAMEDLLRGMPLEDLAVPGMTVKEFWQHRDKNYMKFEYGKPCVPKHVHVNLSFIIKKFLEWYYLACVFWLNFIEPNIPGDIFKTSNFDLHVELAELHTIFCLKMLDITMMTIWCMQVL